MAIAAVLSGAIRRRAKRSEKSATTLPVRRPMLGQHWGIENKPHWVLDVGFGEDLDRKRARYAAQNFSVLDRIALNLLKQDKSSKRGIHGKRLKAGWDNGYLPHLLGN